MITMPSNKELCEQFNLTKAELKLTRNNKGYHVMIVQGSKDNLLKYPNIGLKLGSNTPMEVLDSNNKPVYLGLPLVKKGES
tara:strand:- start:8875 stop:9117 length:243 start_codon:yes stop_codon:yes gene_type:complete